MAADPPGQRRGAAGLRLCQQGQRIMLQIAEIQPAPLQFGRRIAAVKFQHQFPQRIQQRRQLFLVAAVIRLFHQKDPGFQLGQLRGCLAADDQNTVFFRGAGGVADPRKRRKIRLPDLLGAAIPRRRFQLLPEPFQHGAVLLQQRQQAVAQRIASLCRRQAALQRRQGAIQCIRRVAAQNAAPRRFIQGGLAVCRNVPCRPSAVTGMVTQKAVQQQQRGGDFFIVAAAGKQLDQPHERGVCGLIFFIQQLLQHRSLQQRHFALLPQGKIPGQPQQVEVFPDQPVAEGVDGTDLRAAQQQRLAAQRRIFRLLLHPFRKASGNALAHFLRRRIGKGDNEQPVKIHRRRPVGDEGQHPFGQNGGFSAAGGRRNQQVAAAGRDCLPLRAGPLALAHSSPSFSPISLCGASGAVLLHRPV